MTNAELQQRMVRNTVSNYVRTAVAMIAGLVTFRLLYQHFDKEEFGFWSLLWSVFGYGILLDFGFGFAAQKRVAELSVAKDWAQLGRVLSSILVFYSGIALALAGTALLASPWLIEWFHVSPSRSEEFRWVMVVFFAGIGLAFPMGIFPEILRGQQRISLVNWLITVALVLRVALIIAAMHWHWSFMSIVCIALGSSLGPDVIAAFLAMKRMPEVKLSLRAFDLGCMGDTAKFSAFAYLSTATNLVLAKTDQIVITTTLGVAAIVLYQSGAKVAEVFREFTKQVQESLSPAAAHLHASGHRGELRDLMINGTRWSVIIATPLYLLCAFYLHELVQLLTGDAALSRETWLVGQVLLFWYYTSVITHSVSKRIFMMTGHERKLMWLGVAEACANLGISITLALWMKSVVAVALGSLIPTLWFGWVHLWRWVARDSGMSSMALLRATVLPSLAACAPALLLLIAFQHVALAPNANPLIAMLVESSIAGLIAIAGLWRFALRPSERHRLLARICRQPIAQPA